MSPTRHSGPGWPYDQRDWLSIFGLGNRELTGLGRKHFSRASRIAGGDVRLGPTSGTLPTNNPINSVEVPFKRRQPVQGFSAVLNNGDGTLLVL
jgi:hypothetical protein